MPTAAPQPQANPNPSAPSVRGMTNIVDALYSKGLIDDESLRKLKFESVTTGIPYEQIIVSKGLVSEENLQRTRAEMYGIGYIDLSSISIAPEVLSRLPVDIARTNMSVAFEETASRVKVATVDPLDLQRVSLLESLLKKKIDAYYATSSQIQHTIDTKYNTQVNAEVSEALEDIGVVDLSQPQGGDLNSEEINSAPVAKIVNMILDYAVKHHASDVHVEPREGKVSVRYRIHGILAEKLTLPSSLAPSVISRIKILANMKIDEHRVPQDNRFQVKSEGGSVDIRVSVMPCIYGEKVVMRLLEKGGGTMTLESTGMRGPALKIYRESLNKTQGIILITGPTGSGKTQTLASSLAILNKQEVNILTVEDPVEIRISGITQVQVNAEVGLTFASALRAFLRQDPDIIMVGEIRDVETANLAVQAALTGHLVLATLHTNSAAGALPRLLDMGIQPFLLSSTINVVIAQRLVRRLCDDCKRAVDAPPEVMSMLHQKLDSLHGFDIKIDDQNKLHFDSHTQQVKLYEAVGCPKCGDSGYKGRIGIFECMQNSEKIGQMVMAALPASEIQKQATAEGMIDMLQDGMMKAVQGLTTLEEVLRVQNV